MARCGIFRKLSKTRIKFSGSDSNEVGSVHLGVVHAFELEGDAVSSNEDAIQNIRFVPLEELYADRENLETWSRICVEHVWSQQ